MFDQKDNRIDQSYIEIHEHTATTAYEFAKLLMELLKKLNEKWQEHQENKKVAVKVDEETYNLVEDPDTPGAYKWEKVDLNKDSTTSPETQSNIIDEFTEIDSNPSNSEPIQYSAEIEQPFTEYQAQTIVTRLISSFSPENSTEYNYDFSDEQPTIQITATTESSETKVLYAQLENGEVVKNAFTEGLSQEEIINTAYEPLSKLLPPDSPLLLSPGKDNIETIAQSSDEENITITADDMLSKILQGEVFEVSNSSDITNIDYSENSIGQSSVEINQPLQYDTDGLIIETDTKETQKGLNDEISAEIDEFTQVDEMPNTNEEIEVNQLPQYDADGLVLEENITITNNNEIIEETPIVGTKVVTAVSVTQGINTATTESVGAVPESIAEQIGNVVTGAVANEVMVDTAINKEQIDAEKSTITETVEAKVEEKLNDNQNNIDNSDSNNNLRIETSEINNSNQSNLATFIAGLTANDISINEVSQEKINQPINTEIQEEVIIPTKNPNVEIQEETSLTIKKPNTEIQEEAPLPKKTASNQQEEPSANYTYQTIASNPEVEPRAQQWARQSVIPVYEIKYRGEKTKVEYENNKNIALSATEMLKKYGTIETDGSRIYRSDAFTIRKQDGIVSIHRRGDEARGFKEPLMEFKLNKDGTPDIKEGNIINNLRGKTTKHNLSPVEKQEFLIVAELINEKKGLPDLQKTDIREMGNALGSLAPAGTLRTLQSFKETEVLGILNNTLNQAKKETVTVGDFTIKRERDPDNENRASLILTKDSNDGRGQQTLVQFDLEKTENGVESSVTKMNISDYDINQVKQIYQNAYKRNQNLEMNFGTTNQQASTKTEIEANTRNLGQVAVNTHPWVQKEWVQMVDDLQENPPHTPEIEEGLQEIKDRMGKTPGKATIPDQCIMYDKIITHKTAVAQESDDPNATVSFMNKNDIIQDLKELRLKEISQEFTPTQNLTQKQAQTKQETKQETPSRPTPRSKKEELEV